MVFQSVTPSGRIKSFVVLWDTPVPGFEAGQPVILASVELVEQEGLMLQANLLGVDPSDVQIGQEVKIVWEELRDGVVLPQFELTGGYMI
jgi:hypothetical protein